MAAAWQRQMEANRQVSIRELFRSVVGSSYYRGLQLAAVERRERKKQLARELAK